MLLALVEVDAEPRREQLEDVARGMVGVEVVGERVEDRDDRVEQLLERADEAHPEITILI